MLNEDVRRSDGRGNFNAARGRCAPDSHLFDNEKSRFHDRALFDHTEHGDPALLARLGRFMDLVEHWDPFDLYRLICEYGRDRDGPLLNDRPKNDALSLSLLLSDLKFFADDRDDFRARSTVILAQG